MAGSRRKFRVPFRTRAATKVGAPAPRGSPPATGHADIDDGHGEPALARQHVDRRPTRPEVANHGRGDLGGIGADPFGRDPVIRREHEQLSAPGNPDRELPANAGVPDRQIFQTPQAARRLRELRLVRPRPGHGVPIERGDG